MAETKKNKYAKKPNWKKATGRPSVMTEEVIGKLESILKIDWTIGEACSYAWIDQSTYYDWVKKDIRFSKKMTAAQDYPFILARKTLMKGMQNGDQRSAIEYLKRRDRRYKDKQELEHSGDVDIKNINVEIKTTTV